MPDQAPKIDSFSGKGRLVYDKARRTIVTVPPAEIGEPVIRNVLATYFKLFPSDDPYDNEVRINQVVEHYNRLP